MSDYFYLVAADKKYIPELCVLLNSLDFVGNKQDVHVVGVNLEDAFTCQFEKLGYTVIHHVISSDEVEAGRGISEIVCRKRYWYAAEYGKSYKAGCILDADLIFVRDPLPFFKIAEKTGFILAPCKEQNKVYDDPHHQANGEWIIPKGTWNDKDLCNCPMFLDTELHSKALKESWDIFINQGFKAPDMDACNICFLKYSGAENILPLPGIQWLGTNEQLLKPYIRAVEKRDGKIWTESGIMIYVYHGQFYHPKWVQCQLDNRHGCASRYLKAHEQCDEIAKGAMNVLKEYFDKMMDYNIVIEKRDYRHE